mmetsp:Transcript_51381/g.171494  ORF Transcript_51381/g.171494 Transcript_51381/m.171494 type:complete len:217 (+) Transcript_51381:379-1029(+)
MMSIRDPCGVAPHSSPSERINASPLSRTLWSAKAAVKREKSTFPSACAASALLHDTMHAVPSERAHARFGPPTPRSRGAIRSSRSACRTAVRRLARSSHASASPLPGKSASRETCRPWLSTAAAPGSRSDSGTAQTGTLAGSAPGSPLAPAPDEAECAGGAGRRGAPRLRPLPRSRRSLAATASSESPPAPALSDAEGRTAHLHGRDPGTGPGACE